MITYEEAQILVYMGMLAALILFVAGLLEFISSKTKAKPPRPMYMQGKWNVIAKDGFFEVVSHENHKVVWNRHNNYQDAVDEIVSRNNIGMRSFPKPDIWHYCENGRVKPYSKGLCSSAPYGHGNDFEPRREIIRLNEQIKKLVKESCEGRSHE